MGSVRKFIGVIGGGLGAAANVIALIVWGWNLTNAVVVVFCAVSATASYCLARNF